MRIDTLKLCNFRNFQYEVINPSQGVNLVVGRNAQGKTNLVEAVSFVSQGKSFRSQSASELVRWGEKSASVFASVKEKLSEFELGIAISDGSRQAFVNGDQTRSLSEYVGRLLCVTFSPDDLELVKGQPSVRRRFIDRHIVELDPGLMNAYLTYSKALKNKNKLLSSGSPSEAMISSWNALMAESGFKISRARRSFLREIRDIANEIHSRFAGEDGDVELTLKSNIDEYYDEQDAGKLSTLFQNSRNLELFRHSSIVGPHRDDVTITIGGNPAREFASQGQARSLVLSLKLAVIELIERKRGDSPVVLLDDVDAELDDERGGRFFEMVLSDNRQIFITGTDLRLRDQCTRRECALMEIERGKIRFI